MIEQIGQRWAFSSDFIAEISSFKGYNDTLCEYIIVKHFKGMHYEGENNIWTKPSFSAKKEKWKYLPGQDRINEIT